ncbi:hypothetical protein, partial [Ralstonia pseudosolanacearum]|uniref:hypothetical protein n=1 Tax=Ralstonia pseudosolanacearum TaxID=1310165 RepID=UPI003CECB74D
TPSLEDGFLTRLASQRNYFDAILLLTCAAGFIQALRTGNWHIISLVVAFSFLLVIFFLISLVQPILLERVVVFGLPIVFILVAFLLTTLPAKRLAVTAMSVMLFFQAVNLANYYLNFEKEGWR